jgi:hypothetical protein
VSVVVVKRHHLDVPVDELVPTIAGRAATAGVGLQTTAAFAVDREPMPGILFGYGGIPTEHIGEGLARLRGAFRT